MEDEFDIPRDSAEMTKLVEAHAERAAHEETLQRLILALVSLPRDAALRPALRAWRTRLLSDLRDLRGSRQTFVGPASVGELSAASGNARLQDTLADLHASIERATKHLE